MPEENKHINSERQVYQDSQGNTHTRVTRNSETVRNKLPEEYRDGYTYGRLDERRVQDETQIVRDDENTSRGLLLGVIFISLLGLAGAFLYYLSQRNNEPVPAPSPTVTLSPTPSPQSTIIERVPTVVPVPQPQTTTSPAPDINIQQVPATPSPSPTADSRPNIINIQPPAATSSPSPTADSRPNIINIQPPAATPSPSPTSGANPDFSRPRSLTTPSPSPTLGTSPNTNTTISPSPSATLGTPGQTTPLPTTSPNFDVAPQSSPNTTDTRPDSDSTPNNAGTTNP